MNNRTDPECRDAFIAARKRQGQSRGLEWHTFGDGPEDWDWDTDRTDWEYHGWCILWKPPSDAGEAWALWSHPEEAECQISQCHAPRTEGEQATGWDWIVEDADGECNIAAVFFDKAAADVMQRELARSARDVNPAALLGKLKAHVAASTRFFEESGCGLLASQVSAAPGVLTADLIEVIETQRQQIDDGIAGIQQAEAVIDQLPKTVDGVPVTPETKLWHCCKYRDEVRMVTRDVDCRYMPSSGGSQLNIQHVGEDQCYSTREAAEAAKVTL